MNQKVVFRRKIVYLSLMIGLLFPLSWLGLPSVSEGDRDRQVSELSQVVQQPRVLASLQHQHGLAEANLGKIDPSSATLKLATFGLRGVAANLLWNQADRYKMTENWSKLESVLDQISYLQPNFVSVWRFQGWNLAYNVSAEWDDYRGRYYWVLKGTNYVHGGQAYNARDVRLVWDEGWFTGHKIGRADEYLQFRKLFHDQVALGRTPDAAEGDESEFPAIPPARKPDLPPDNWMYSWAVFLDAVDLVTNGGATRYGAGGSDTVFFSEPAKTRIRYVAAKVEEGEFSDEIAVNGWRRARQEWEEFGDREIAGGDGEPIRLNELAEIQKQLDEKLGQLESLSLKTREQLKQERLANLTDQDRELYANPNLAMNSLDGVTRMQAIVQRVNVTHRDLALNAPAENRTRSFQLADEVQALEARLSLIRSRHSVVNYEYWHTRCIVEGGGTQEDYDRMVTRLKADGKTPLTKTYNPALEARKLMHLAHQMYDEDPLTAREPYEQSFAIWHGIMHDYPVMEGDGEIYDDLLNEIRRYERVLDHHGERMTENFILKDLLVERAPYPPIGPFGRNESPPDTMPPPETTPPPMPMP